MDQLSMFDDGPHYPQTYEDIDALYHAYIDEGETDDDVITSSNTKLGRSYAFYGTKAFDFVPGAAGKSRLKLRPAQLDAIGLHRDSADPLQFYTVPDLTPEQLLALCASLRQLKRDTFRALVTETFACCNDFVRCSDARACLHPEDRFCNGCTYRTNLEAGRIYFGHNRNV